MLGDIVLPLAAERRRGGEQQLPREPERRAHDLDAARLPGHDVRAEQVRVPADQGGARQARPGDRGLDRRRRRSPRRSPTRCSPSTASASRRPATQADDIVARARKNAETFERDSQDQARQKREELLEQTRKDIDAETRRAIEEIRTEVADLTILATEKVTAQVAHRRGPEAPRRRGARPSSTSRR